MPEPEPSVQEPIAASVLSGLVQDKPSAKPDGIEANVSEAGPVDEAHEPPPAVVEPQRAEAPAEQQAGQRHAPHEEGETEERWYMKRIYWPPLPRLPSGHQADLPSVRIICQNRNGPCSLLALCNILILRHEIFIPHRLEYVTYSDLSNIIADYLLAHPFPRLSLERALKVLPTTQYGLSLNPRFGSIDGFAPLFPATDAEGPAKESDEVLLFAACGIQLVHGWLPDPQDDESWRVLVEQHGDYDEVIKAMIEGEEIGGPRPSDHDAPDVAALIVDRWTSLSPADRLKVRDASTIRSFLDNSSTQITINGLFRLSELAPNSLVALFRNSHLSVLFVRPPSPDEHVERTTPKLFELVTDEGMRDSLVVWESLVDTSGAGDWYDASLKRISGNKRQLTDEELARRMAGHSVQSDEEYARAIAAEQRPQTDEEYARALQADEQSPINDAELARRLQYEEDERGRRRNELEQRSSSHRRSASASGRHPPPTSTTKPPKAKKSKDCVVS